MSRRVRWAVTGALALALAALTALLLLPEQPAPQARDSAVGACREVRSFLTDVQRNGPAQEAVQALGRAVSQGRDASAADPAWVALSSGIDSLRLAVQRDDRAAARVGVAVVRSECARVGIELTGTG